MSAQQSSGRTLTVEAHVGLVRRVAKQRARGAEHCSEEDLFQAGCIGLLKAIEKFDPARGCAFSTYAVLWIKQAIGRELQKNDRCVRLPVWQHAKLYREGKLRRERARSFDAPLKPDAGDDCLHDVLGELGADPIASLAGGQDAAELAEAMARLTEKERLVLRERFWGERTLQQVGEELGVTRERARQIEAEALEKLRFRLG